MAYQWIHVEAVSDAGRDIYRNTANGKKEKTGHISIKSVLGEAGRLDGYISHIQAPLPPVILYGDKERGIEDVRERVEDWLSGTKDARGHKVRKDAHALLSSVISFPPVGDDEDINDYDTRRNKFENAMLDYLKEEYGNDLILVIRHDDEPFKGINAGKIHYHWHFFCVKRSGEKFDLHPGFKARAEYNVPRKEREKMTRDELKEIYKQGVEAYADAMVDFQDRFFEGLGKKHGLNRKGPSRLRRSRHEQTELENYIEKELVQSKQTIAEAETIKSKAESLNAEAEALRAEAEKLKVEAASKNAKAKHLMLEADSIRQSSVEQSDEIRKKAVVQAQDIKAKAWIEANDITNAANKYASSIIDSARYFIDELLGKVSKLTGGTAVINWARSFMKSIAPKEQLPASRDQKGDKIHSGRKL